MKPRRLICLFLALLICATLSFGQAVTGALLGTVTDASGATVPNAKVTITDVNTGTNRNARTNESGNYSFADLPPGKYSVSVELQGFKKFVVSGQDVLVNSTVRVDAVLQPGNVNESIEIHAESS